MSELITRWVSVQPVQKAKKLKKKSQKVNKHKGKTSLAERILTVLEDSGVKWMTPVEIGFSVLGIRPKNRLEEELFRRVLLPRVVEEVAGLSREGKIEVRQLDGVLFCRVKG